MIALFMLFTFLKLALVCAWYSVFLFLFPDFVSFRLWITCYVYNSNIAIRGVNALVHAVLLVVSGAVLPILRFLRFTSPVDTTSVLDQGILHWCVRMATARPSSDGQFRWRRDTAMDTLQKWWPWCGCGTSTPPSRKAVVEVWFVRCSEAME